MSEIRFAKCRPIFSLAFLVCLVGLTSAVIHPVSAQKPSPPKLLAGGESPAFPEQAQDKLIVGDVVFRARLTAEGSVESVDILQVPEKGLGFEDSVRATVMGWEFEPASDGTNPIPYVYIGKISFTLRPDDEVAIRETVEKAAAEWNKGNAGKLASYFDKKDGRILGTKELAKSSKKIKAWISNQLSGQYKNSQLKVTVNSIVFFPDNDLAMIRPFFTVSGTGGQNEEPFRGRLKLVLLKEKGRWNALSGQFVSSIGSQDFRVPKRVKEVDPDYPSKAREKSVEGTVVLEGIVDLSGKLKDVEVLRSIPELDKAAIDAVKKWEYEPALVNGEPTAMVTTMTVSFTSEE
jgi:uncharacterized protein (TIGR02246 family)